MAIPSIEDINDDIEAFRSGLANINAEFRRAEAAAKTARQFQSTINTLLGRYRNTLIGILPVMLAEVNLYRRLNERLEQQLNLTQTQRLIQERTVEKNYQEQLELDNIRSMAANTIDELQRRRGANDRVTTDATSARDRVRMAQEQYTAQMAMVRSQRELAQSMLAATLPGTPNHARATTMLDDADDVERRITSDLNSLRANEQYTSALKVENDDAIRSLTNTLTQIANNWNETDGITARLNNDLSNLDSVAQQVTESLQNAQHEVAELSEAERRIGLERIAARTAMLTTIVNNTIQALTTFINGIRDTQQLFCQRGAGPQPERAH